jgi:hypothetical protein
LGPVGRKYIEGERDRGKGAPPVEEEKKETPGRKELREKRLPQDLCVNLENCRDLSVKHNFSLI